MLNLMADDDFLDFFSKTLADVAGIDDKPLEAKPPVVVAAPPPVSPAPPAGKLVYVGFDDATRNVFKQNFGDAMPFVETVDLQQVKTLLVAKQVALLVFDSTSFIKPGIPVTRFIKEKGLPVKVAHIYAPQRVTEEYEKYRQYHVHLQPDYQAISDEIFVAVESIRKDFGL